MIQKIVIIGAGGHAREVLDIFEACNSLKQNSYEVLGYIVEGNHGTAGEIVNDRPILGDFDWFWGKTEEIKAICGVGSPELRQRLVNKAVSYNVEFTNAIHPGAAITQKIEMQKGVIVAAGAILTNNIKLGWHVHINIASTISHDCNLADFVTLSPGTHLAGNVTIGKGSFIGIGANVIPNIVIGEWATIGAGSTVIKNVPDRATVVGVPGRVVTPTESN